MRVTTDVVEIRGKEVKTSQVGKEYMIVRFEDETGKTYEVCDRNMARLSEYTKGRECRLTIDITMDKWKNMSIVGIVEA